MVRPITSHASVIRPQYLRIQSGASSRPAAARPAAKTPKRAERPPETNKPMQKAALHIKPAKRSQNIWTLTNMNNPNSELMAMMLANANTSRSSPLARKCVPSIISLPSVTPKAESSPRVSKI